MRLLADPRFRYNIAQFDGSLLMQNNFPTFSFRWPLIYFAWVIEQDYKSFRISKPNELVSSLNAVLCRYSPTDVMNQRREHIMTERIYFQCKAHRVVTMTDLNHVWE